MLAKFGLSKWSAATAGETGTSEDHWKTTYSLEPWAGWSSVSSRRRSGSPVRYSTGSGAHDGSVRPRDTQGVSRANTSGGGRGHRHWVARPVPQG